MGVRVTDLTDTIMGTTKQRASIFIRILAENIVDTARPVTPRDMGNLSNDVLKTVNGLSGKIEWNKDYAQYQERGMRRDGTRVVKNYTTPGTGKHFAYNSVKKVTDKTSIIAKQAHLI